jgi:hypothetical protein
MPSGRRSSRSLNARKKARKVRSKERKAREARDAKKLASKKLALELHNKRNDQAHFEAQERNKRNDQAYFEAQERNKRNDQAYFEAQEINKRNAEAHYEAQKRKIEYELEKYENVVYFDDIKQQQIATIIDKDIEDFLWLKGLMSNSRIENELLRLYIPDLYFLNLISLNKTIRAINDKIDALNELFERALYTQIVYGVLKVTVVPDSVGVRVYIIVPSTHKKFKTCTHKKIRSCTAHFSYYTYNEVLDDGSRQIGWDFGEPNEMLMYNINKLITQTGNGPLSSTELGDKISSLCIITMKDVNELIVKQILSLFNTCICSNS